MSNGNLTHEVKADPVEDPVSNPPYTQPLTVSKVQSLIKPYFIKGIKEASEEKKKTIVGSVGKGGKNDPADVKLIQNRLLALGLLSESDYASEQPGTSDGEKKVLGLNKAIEAINTLQKYLFKGDSFGIVKPGLQTMEALRVMNTDDLARLKVRYQEQTVAKAKEEQQAKAKVLEEAKINQLKSEPSTEEHAQKISDKFQDAVALGKHLSQYASYNDRYVIVVMEKKWYWETDDVALQLAKNLSDSDLKKCSKHLLQYLSARLSEGWTTEEEKVQIGRIHSFFNQKENMKEDRNNIKISSEVLREIFPKAKEDHLKNLVEEISKNGNKYGIDSYDKLAHYLAQAGHETGGFSQDATVEGGSYPTVERVKEVFGSRDIPYKKAKENPEYYLKHSERFLNMAYANKLGNGDENSGEGYKYKGRGYFQLTGKENYTNFNKFSKKELNEQDDFVSHPELIGNNNKHAITSSLWYFKTRTVSSINDKLTFKKITQTINAGAVEVEKREAIYEKAKNIFKKHYK